MSRKQSGKLVRGNRKYDAERKRDERAVRRAIAKDRKNRPQGDDEGAEFISFTNQLQALGLKLREVPGDGNCLFRALGDQLEGHSRGHLRLRQETVQYMQAHRHDFEPFVEDDVPFTQHLANLSQPGTFAGNDAIVAFARSQQLRVVIHQLNAPLWEINGSEKPVCRELHIAYRYGDHYDSVRPVGDNSESPTQLRIETLNRSRGQGESGGRQGDRKNVPPCPLPEEDDLILHCLEPHSPAGQGESCCQLDGASPHSASEELDPVLSVTACPAQWEESETCPSLPVSLTECSDSKSSEEGVVSQRPKISNRQRKEHQRLEKKRRQEERHRQKVLQSRAPQDQNQNLSEPVTLVPALSTLSI
ncbi:OTU domain-containing protein 3 [Anguilla anguilla]|uniref:OTU domain-containing protein 3 n=1 Tax=Anguilla anguilla TaxID=7936 RepID=UPI0015A885AC|nr:OTU domain-containing protein 3 [Anguilla anguilla]